MRILQVVPVFYPALAHGGMAMFPYEVSRILAQRGHEVTAYTTDANDANSRLDSRFKNIDGIETYYFRNISNWLAWKHHLFISPALISATREKMKGVDILHLHGFRDFQSIVAHYYARKAGIPYVLQAHGSALRIGKERLKKSFDLLFGYRILRDASRLIALNKTEAERYQEMGVDGDRIEIIPTAIKLSKYSELPERDTFRKKYKIGIREKLVLYLGRIHQSKDIDLLVKAFADVNKVLSNARLVIAGLDDGFLPTLEKLVAELNIGHKVLFAGFIPSEDRLAAYVDADVFVTPSFYGFPVTFTEAWACGTPVITTTKGDYIEEIDNQVGYVVQFNEKQLQQALIKILSDEKEKERFSQNAKELVRKYDYEAIVSRIEDIYQRVIQHTVR